MQDVVTFVAFLAVAWGLPVNVWRTSDEVMKERGGDDEL